MKLCYKRVLLCMPPLPGVYQGVPPAPPGGIGYLSEVLSQENIENDVIDMRLGYTLEDLKNKIKKFKPDLIGFTVNTYRYDVPYSYISSIKCKDFDIMVGGPQASVERKKIFEEIDVEYVTKFGGEKLIVELCKGKPLEEIKGLIYKKDKEIIENPDEIDLDLSKLPFPKYKKFELNKYIRKQIKISTTQGCLYKCTFCSVAAVTGRRLRIKDPSLVIEEFKYWYDKGYREFDIVDDNFIFDKQRTLDICNGLINNGIKNLDITCGGIRADSVDREILEKMRIVGFKQISFGVEGGNNKMLKLIKKSETIEQIEESIKIACELGFDVCLFFIIGMPGETVKDVKDSFRLALKYPINNANFHNAVPTPDTELYNYVVKNNLFVVKHPDYLNDISQFEGMPIFETPEFPLIKRLKMLKQAKKIEKEVLRRTFARKLRRYSILGEISSHIVFFKPFYSFLQKSMRYSKTVKKTLVYFARRFDLKGMETIR